MLKRSNDFNATARRYIFLDNIEHAETTTFFTNWL
jgi:hypothetical protein